MNTTTEQINTIMKEHSVPKSDDAMLNDAILKLELEKLVILAKIEAFDELKVKQIDHEHII